MPTNQNVTILPTDTGCKILNFIRIYYNLHPVKFKDGGDKHLPGR